MGLKIPVEFTPSRHIYSIYPSGLASSEDRDDPQTTCAPFRVRLSYAAYHTEDAGVGRVTTFKGQLVLHSRTTPPVIRALPL